MGRARRSGQALRLRSAPPGLLGCPRCRQCPPGLPGQLALPALPPARAAGAEGRGVQFAAFVPSLHLVNRHEFTDGYLVALRCCNTSACVLVVLLFFGNGLCLCRLWYNDIGLS